MYNTYTIFHVTKVSKCDTRNSIILSLVLHKLFHLQEFHLSFQTCMYLPFIERVSENSKQ